MDPVKCEAFLAAAELGSLTAASESLGYTQSGVTRMISALENELGFPLLLRSKKGVSLTENGRSILPLCRDLVHASGSLEQMGAELRSMVKGTLTIGCYYSISAHLLPEILKRYRALYPGVRIRMQEGGNREMNHWLSERSVDLCIGAEPRRKDCDWIPIFQDEIVVWLPKDHPLADQKVFPIKQLEHEAFIHTQPGQDTDLDRLLEKLKLHPDTAFSTRDAFTTYNMVATGLGVSFNQRLISRKWSGDVAELPFDPPQYVSLGLMLPSLLEASPAARKFIELVKTDLHYRRSVSESITGSVSE